MDSHRIDSVLKRLLPHALLCLGMSWADAQADDARQWRDGQQLYDKVCGHCHKPSVGVGTVLEGRELPLAYLKIIVRNGLNAMPAFPESYIDDASLEAVGQYLGSLPTPAPPPETQP